MLIKNGATPKNIVAFTFTNKAAEELKGRIRGKLQEEFNDKADIGDMFIGTIDAFCLLLLKELEPKYRSYDVLDEAQRTAFVNRWYGNRKDIGIRLLPLSRKNITGRTLGKWETIEMFCKSADIVTLEGIDTSKLTDRRFAECYKQYRKLLDDEFLFDFSTVIRTLVELLKDNTKKMRIISERFKHVTLDEYQDVSQIQETLLELLSKGAESICVVGDDDQNLYSWRGTNVELIEKFRERYEKNGYDVTTVKISTNFRSTDAIVNASRSFVEHNNGRLDKDMTADEKQKLTFEDGDMIYREFETGTEELDFIRDRINELKGTEFTDKRGKFALSYADCAVLARTNGIAERVINYFESLPEPIPCIAFSGMSVFDRPIVMFALDCIGYVFDCDIVDLREWVPRQYRPDLHELRTRYMENNILGTFPDADAEKFAEKLKQVKKQADVIKAKPKDYFPTNGLGLQEFFHNILNAMGREDFDFDDDRDYNLSVMSKVIADFESVYKRLRASQVSNLPWFIWMFAYSKYQDPKYNDPTLINAVRVMTIHKAKGLQFPAVFIPEFIQRRNPPESQNFVDNGLYNAELFANRVEDERRAYYTAMTRAEKYLAITMGRRIDDGPRRRERRPSIFRDEVIDSSFSETSTKRPKSKAKERVQKEEIYPTSFSQLNTYSRCPADFRLRSIIQYKAGVPAAYGYGTNIHNMLNAIHQGYIEDRKTPSDADIDKMFDDMFHMRYATPKITENMKKGAMKIIKSYVDIHKGDFGRILETEKNFELVVENALITGQIDLLKKFDEKGNVAEVEIVDFKSMEKKDGVYETNYEKQLRYYAIACLDSLGLKPEKAVVHHLSDNKKHEVDISEKLLQITKNEIRNSVNNVLTRNYPATPDRKTCEGCDWARICPHKKFDVGVSFRE